MGAAAMVTMVGSFSCVLFTITHRFGPLSLMGLGMLFIMVMMIALPVLGVIPAVLRWLGLKPGHAQ